ncbi:hypothetical protein QOT17_010431 [Balamuthia mandrillaris]
MEGQSQLEQNKPREPSALEDLTVQTPKGKIYTQSVESQPAHRKENPFPKDPMTAEERDKYAESLQKKADEEKDKSKTQKDPKFITEMEGKARYHHSAAAEMRDHKGEDQGRLLGDMQPNSPRLRERNK